MNIKSGDYCTEACERWLRQGHGRGVGASYKPWVTIRSCKSEGRSSGIYGLTIPRIHEVVSDLEHCVFHIADFLEDIVDIREQFPLLPVDAVQALAAEVGITYPKIRGNAWIISTDFLLTRRNGEFLAVSVKPESKLATKKVRDTLELERLWWNSLGIKWMLATDRELSSIITENLADISFPFRGADNPIAELDTSPLLELSSRLEPKLYLQKDLIALITREISADHDEAKHLLYKSILNHELTIDLNSSISKTGLIKILKWKLHGQRPEVKKYGASN